MWAIWLRLCLNPPMLEYYLVKLMYVAIHQIPLHILNLTQELGLYKLLETVLVLNGNQDYVWLDFILLVKFPLILEYNSKFR